VAAPIFHSWLARCFHVPGNFRVREVSAGYSEAGWHDWRNSQFVIPYRKKDGSLGDSSSSEVDSFWNNA
jgi:hypothetical protein